MTRGVIIHELYDWSKCDAKEDFWNEIDFSKKGNFYIQEYNNEIWTNGYVGVTRILNYENEIIRENSKDHVLSIKSKYKMNPWEMLETVIQDEEYQSYVDEMKINKKSLFEIFYEQEVIKLEQDEANNSDLLYAISFINSCYSLCKKGLKNTMHSNEKNYNSKIKGKIDIKKNMKKNTFKGRGDRFYCKNIEFNNDNIENRIIKTTLMNCKKILEKRFVLNKNLSSRIMYCINTFKNVKNIKIKSSDFNNVSVSGLYIYYKPVLNQAKSIFSQRYYSYKDTTNNITTKSMYTIPYVINMETLFEFFARSILKRNMDRSKYLIESYSEKIFLEQNVSSTIYASKNTHLMSYCIPDIIVKSKNDGKILFILDAKYKSNTRSDRGDSLQLLSYVLLTGAKKCGFIFPGELSEVKQFNSSSSDFLTLNTPLMSELNYYELIIDSSVKNQVVEIFPFD